MYSSLCFSLLAKLAELVLTEGEGKLFGLTDPQGKTGAVCHNAAVVFHIKNVIHVQDQAFVDHQKAAVLACKLQKFRGCHAGAYKATVLQMDIQIMGICGGRLDVRQKDRNILSVAVHFNIA